MNRLLNVAAYRFVAITLTEVSEFADFLKKKTKALNLKGTILLSQEGINLFLAGEPEAVLAFKLALNDIKKFQDLSYKESFSAKQPFDKMLVKVKRAIIPFGAESVDSLTDLAHTYLPPEVFKTWLDTEEDMLVLDVRNHYEVQFGTFKKAVHLNLKHFRDFPAAAEEFMKDEGKPVVMFCTGGIRCEKATAFLVQEGFKNVYQLHGGILNYFEKCGGEHYQGSCFVFDQRVALMPDLQPLEPA